MDFSGLIIWLLGVVGLSFFLIPFLPLKVKPYAAFGLVTAVTILSSYLAIWTLIYGHIEILFNGGLVFGTIPLRVDPLSAWFVLVVNITAFTGAWYGIGYTAERGGSSAHRSFHWISFVVFHASMLFVCMVQHSFAFLVVWEIMTVSSVLLILFEYDNPKTVKAALNYLVQMHVGVALITVAFIIGYQISGSLDFNSFGAVFNQEMGKWIALTFFLGFGIKAGFIPLHTWLPHAHPAAPSHISGVMSGVIVKMGIYGILRMIVYLKNDLVLIGEIILIVSVLTAFYGILYAALNRDFKKVLAYCTVENIGIIGMGTGLGLIGKGLGNHTIEYIGFSGAVLHVLNHSLYKSLLFFAAGNVYLKTHTRNMEHLGGLIRPMPLTAIFFLCGSLAICGFPPFNGFISEFLIYSGLIEGIQLENIQFSSLMIICISFLAIVGGISLFAFTKMFGVMFLGSSRQEISHQPKEVNRFMLMPLAIILIIMIGIGIFPHLLIFPLSEVVSVFSPVSLPLNNLSATLNIMSHIGFASLLLFIMSAALFLVKKRTERKQTVTVSPTWGCGYTVPNPRMQYSSRSYSRSLNKLFSFMVLEKKKYKEIAPETVFPKYRSFQSYFLDFLEAIFIQRTVKYMLRFTDYFTFIHNGRIQLYILYGVFFILGLIVITFFNMF